MADEPGLHRIARFPASSTAWDQSIAVETDYNRLMTLKTKRVNSEKTSWREIRLRRMQTCESKRLSTTKNLYRRTRQTVHKHFGTKACCFQMYAGPCSKKKGQRWYIFFWLIRAQKCTEWRTDTEKRHTTIDINWPWQVWELNMLTTVHGCCEDRERTVSLR